MNRRKFLKRTAVLGSSAVSMPYILPSGRLFAQSGIPKADHVVYVMFAGGVRQQESVLQRYLEDSQGINIGGNILYNLLEGDAPDQKIVYGTNGGGVPGGVPIPKLLNETIQKQGTLFKEVRATTSGHYAGLNTLLTGNTARTQGLRQKPITPTIFEYARRHLGLKATDVWFVGNRVGNSIPLLDYSTSEDYGIEYAANFISPSTTFGSLGRKHLANTRNYDPVNEIAPMREMTRQLNNIFSSNGGLPQPTIGNTEEEKENIKLFIKEMHKKVGNGTVALPPVSDTGDLNNIGFACEVLKWFKPKIMAINLDNVDVCHSDFSAYLRAMHRGDHGIAHLWNYIQTQIPEMAGNTIMIVTPEHGRNDYPNSIIDRNGWLAYDHNDNNSRRIFTSMVGKSVPVNMQIGDENNQIGLAMDNVVTIADILGFKQDVLNAGYLDAGAASLFDRI